MGIALPDANSAGLQEEAPMLKTKSLRSRWVDLPERGNPAMLRLIQWIALRLGRSIARILLYPITLYFLISADEVRRASHQYLSRIHSSPIRWWHLFSHIHCFGATILDRVYLLKGDFHYFDVTLHQKEILHRQIDSGLGCILLGAHLGSFEVLRTLGVTQQEFPLKVLMNVAHNESLTRVLDTLNPQIASTVIEPDRSDTLLKVKESLDAGFMVGTLGDRVSAPGKSVECQFLGGKAAFPVGPIVLAAIMHCPVILFFGLYRGKNQYDIFFESLGTEISLSRERRTQDIQYWMQRYADRLAHYARLAPYNWFNFYEFWNQ